jgi:hypothetical protein
MPYFKMLTAVVLQVLYWHWGETTATFKATVQSSFQSYGEERVCSLCLLRHCTALHSTDAGLQAELIDQ